MKLFHAAMILDGQGRRFAPGALLMEGRRVVGAGSPQSIGHVSDCQPLQLPDRVLIPALVNAHAHLDLTHLGPMPHDGSFVEWVGKIRAGRAMDDAAIGASVRRGAALSRVGGTGLVGDIAGVGSLAPAAALRRASLPGVSYIEVFGQGQGCALAHERMKAAIEEGELNDRGVRLGLQPHAPYSCSAHVYRAAAKLAEEHGLPLATHLAETVDEIRFVRTADGPIAEMLRDIGVWDESIQPRGTHPVDALADVLSQSPFVAAHLNYIDDAHLEQLAQWPITVAYCPRASEYFGHGLADSRQPTADSHRYREMLQLGVNVALGTDSMVCIDTTDRISVLDDMRLLYQRDSAEPGSLVRMATIAGAIGLGVDPNLVTFAEGPLVGVLALPCDADAPDPSVSALTRNDPPQWCAGPFEIDPMLSNA